MCYRWQVYPTLVFMVTKINTLKALPLFFNCCIFPKSGCGDSIEGANLPSLPLLLRYGQTRTCIKLVINDGHQGTQFASNSAQNKPDLSQIISHRYLWLYISGGWVMDRRMMQRMKKKICLKSCLFWTLSSITAI